MMRYDAQSPAVRAALADAKVDLRIRMNERLSVPEVKRREERLLNPPKPKRK